MHIDEFELERTRELLARIHQHLTEGTSDRPSRTMDTTKPILRIISGEERVAQSPSPELGGELLDEATLAARLGVSRSTLQSWRYARRGPRYIKLGRLVRYRNADVEAFLQRQTHEQAA